MLNLTDLRIYFIKLDPADIHFKEYIFIDLVEAIFIFIMLKAIGALNFSFSLNVLKIENLLIF